MRPPAIVPLSATEETALIAAIPRHAPESMVFTAMEMARLYATLYECRRDRQALAELLRECQPLLGGSTFGLVMKITAVLEQSG